MSLDSEIAVERESRWEVGPTKDVVRAFIETLVDPRLPYKSSINDHPSEDVQKSIARQMHAVVLLYNYYHRKQKPELEFLDFVSFSKLSLSLRSNLKPFMHMIHESEAVELLGAEDNLSVTEKAVKNACDITKSLDASRDVPITEGYPISTVAVLLIDSETENCLLQFNAVTEGVWSLIEKEVNELDVDQELKDRVHKKRKINNQESFPDHSRFLQIGFDAVKEATGIKFSDLVVLDAHVVYSLSKEKLATQFYIMKCKQSFDIKERFPLDSLIESLQGPFAEKFLDTWGTTDVVQYHRLLPYADLISSWLPRKNSSGPILSDCVAQIIKNEDVKKIAPSKIPVPTLAEESVKEWDYIDNSNNRKKTRSTSKAANDDGNISQRLPKQHSSSPKVCSAVNLYKEIPRVATDVSKSRNENADKDSENCEKGSLSGHSSRKSQCIIKDGDALQRIENTNDIFKVPFSRGENENMNSNLKVCDPKNNISSKQDNANVQEDGGNSKEEETADFMELNKSWFGDESLKAEVAARTISSNRNGVTAAEEKVVVHFQALQNEINSEYLQNALAILDRKRQNLYSGLCSMEDKLAIYEHVVDRVRDGGEVGLARRCIEYLVSGKDHLLLQSISQTHGKAQPEKQTRFANIYLPGRSSCQDLEYACLKNNWRLPRYFVQPLHGRFVSSVVVHCMDVILSSKGREESSPHEARESAAAHMIQKIRARFGL